MMDLLDLYYYSNTEQADKRTTDWPLIGSPIYIILATCVYLYIILRWCPNYMKEKQPYSFKTFIKFYNLFQIVTNALAVYHILDAGWFQDYFFVCVEPDYSFDPKAYKFAKISWYIFILKLIDYIETIVFVLRKKKRQVSFLHVYHHVTTLFLSWWVTKYYANGMAATVYFVNCAIHVVMYTYYFLASFGTDFQRTLQPIKPIITIAQMIQFLGLMAYTVYLLLIHCCGMVALSAVALVDLAINFFLFCHFYMTNYASKKVKDKQK